MAFNYSEGIGRIFTIDNRDYFILNMMTHDYAGAISTDYRMIYKDNQGKMQERLFRCTVLFPDGEKVELSTLDDKPLFTFLAAREINAASFITNLCFNRDYSFVIHDYKESLCADPINHNVIAYITMIKQ